MKMKRFLSLLAVLAMVLSMIPAVSFAAEERTVWVDSKKGSNDNSGLTEDDPVKTLASAYAALAGADAGRIVMLSSTSFSGSYSFPKHTIPVTITSKTGAEGLQSGYNLYFGGPTTLENITVTCAADNPWTLLCGNGHKFVVGENVTSLETGGYRFCIQGASNTANSSSVDLTVRSGHWRNIYVGSHAAKTVTGNCKADISGVTVDTSIAISYKGIIQGNVEIKLSDLTCNNTLFACPNQTAGQVGGNVTITLESNVTAPKLYVEGSDRGTVLGSTTVILDGENQFIDTITRGSKPANGGASAVILKSGRIMGSVAADNVSIQVPQDKTLTVDGGALVADTAAGAVVFRGSATLTVGAVEGALSCTVDGAVLPGHVYVTAPAGSAVSFPEATGIKEAAGQWTLGGVSVDVSFCGLVLMAKPDVTVKLYTGFVDGTEVTPVKTETGEMNAYYYELDPGNYRYIASGTGYYKIEKNLYMSDAKLSTRTVVEATPPLRSGEGWEQNSAVRMYTDEVYNGARNEDIAQWPDYADVFTTPYFTEERTAHQMTTQAQLEAFIHKLDDDNDDLYIFSAGRSSGYDFDLPVVVVTKTDLSGATTLEEAAQLVGQSKPTIFYRAHMHGNEPASAEGALAILQRLDGELGDKVLDRVNVVVMPRNNPDGASKYTRNLTSGIDPNGDLARVMFSETEAYLRVFDQFAPELVLDGHEYTTSTTKNYTTNADALIGLGFAQENSVEFQNAYRPMDQLVRENLTKNGLYYRYYEGVVNHNGPQTSRSHAALQGTMFVLIESQGINAGTSGYNRRVITHVVAMQTMIEYVADHANEIQAAVDAERQRIIRLGSTYEESDQVLLELDNTTDSSWQHPVCYIYQDGRTVESTTSPKVWNTVLRSRTAPTAYVIPAGESYTAGVLALMDKHNIAYTFVPAGAQIALQQYSGTVTADSGVTDVSLSAEKTVTFGKGAYVLCKNQVKGILLSALMEPDVTKLIATNSGVVLQGLVPCQNGSFPIYRYCHDLNDEGFVDYTLTQVQPVQLTVWLDGENGLDTGDGLTEATAVKTLEQAYAILEKSLDLSAEGSYGTVKLVGLYDLGTAAFHFPVATYPVVFTGKTTEDGFTYKGGSELAQRHIYLNGDTTFQNMRLHSSSGYTNNYIFANGHKLVMGQGLNTTCTAGKYYYFTLLGGSYDYGQDVASASITVESGTWRMIYCGGYRGSILGTARVEISNATLFAGLYASYLGNVKQLEVYLSDTQVTNEGIFAGTYSANTTNHVGFVQQGSTIVLGKNVTTPAVYCSARTYGGITGGATIVAAGVDLSKAPVKARFAELPEKYSTDYAVLKLTEDVAQNVTMDPGVVLDLNGHNITGNLTVDGTLQVKDTQTDDFTVADGVYGKITGQVTGTLEAAPDYVTADGESFHRFEQRICGTTIRPAVAGVYYTAQWSCDEVLSGKIASFGVAVSVKDMPGTDFRADLDTLWTTFSGSEFANGTKKTSAIISGILKEGKDNDARGKMDIYACAYVILADGTVLTSANGAAYSLYDVMHLAEDTAYETNQEALAAFYNTWKDVMQNWDFQKIGK